MIFWLCLAVAVATSWLLTRGRRVDRWSRFFWGFLAGVGLWLAWLRFGGGP